MQIVFTDLDGTLLNHDDYNYQAALPLLEELKHKQIPVIPVTSKTRREVEALVHHLGLQDPFIVENGSGIFIPHDYKQFPLSEGEKLGDYILVNLGCTYDEARQGLRSVEQALRKDLPVKDLQLQGFGDLSAAQVQKLTNLPLDDAQKAKAREFTEPFVQPKDIPLEKIEKAAEALGFKILIGGRFYHIIGEGAGKGKAVNWLVKQYQTARPEAQITTIGLGDSPNDLDMLEVVDLPIIIPGKKGIHQKLIERGWRVAPFPAPEGWVAALEDVLHDLENEKK
jgi:mannosyl-3-phosphoglycerate phosphatase